MPFTVCKYFYNVFTFSWNNGENHLLFNIVPGAAPDYNTVVDLNTDRAMIAGAGFDTWTYRTGFDIAMPFYSPILDGYEFDDLNGKRYIFLYFCI